MLTDSVSSLGGPSRSPCTWTSHDGEPIRRLLACGRGSDDTKESSPRLRVYGERIILLEYHADGSPSTASGPCEVHENVLDRLQKLTAFLRRPPTRAFTSGLGCSDARSRAKDQHREHPAGVRTTRESPP
jgi:hypothetical protein